MAKSSKISWTKSTFNPWIGCTKIGPGCDHCYAEALDKRARFGGGVHWGANVPRFRTSPKNWEEPLKWNREAPSSVFAGRQGFWPVFCASLADFADNDVPNEWRVDLTRLINATPNLSWLLVTKRIGNVGHLYPGWDTGMVPRNVRIIITVVNQEEADRDIPKLLALRCANGISYEPALGPVHWGNYLSRTNMPGFNLMPGFRDPLPGIEWVIVGGESTQGAGSARPFEVDWARKTIAQCKTAGVAVFVKQLGTKCTIEGAVQGGMRDTLALKDRAGANPDEWPADLRVQEFPR